MHAIYTKVLKSNDKDQIISSLDLLQALCDRTIIRKNKTNKKQKVTPQKQIKITITNKCNLTIMLTLTHSKIM